MQRILVPLDGSPLAEEVLPYAQELASRLSGAVYLVSVVPLARQLAATGFTGAGAIDGVPAMDIKAIDDAVAIQMKEARAYLEGQAQRLQGEGLTVEWDVRQGAVADEIIECARANNIDIIAISSHGRSGVRRLVFGSVSDRVIREAGIPVLVIKQPKDDGNSGPEES